MGDRRAAPVRFPSAAVSTVARLGPRHQKRQAGAGFTTRGIGATLSPGLAVAPYVRTQVRFVQIALDVSQFPSRRPAKVDDEQPEAGRQGMTRTHEGSAEWTMCQSTPARNMTCLAHESPAHIDVVRDNASADRTSPQ